MTDKSKTYKYILIYIYLLVAIAVLLYRFPGLYQFNKRESLQEEIDSKDEYILGGYLKDGQMFNTEEMYFPIALPGEMSRYIYYIDSYGAVRTYGGDRVHEGCDIMTRNNIRGELPVVSVCDGVIEKLGWLELGGYRVGIRSETGVYYYYAHLDSYAQGIEEGDIVSAGQVIGYVGDTGYSKVEGTTGNFDVHLHFGVYVNDEDGCEYALNPYPLLEVIKKSVIKYRLDCFNVSKYMIE
ncbi:MAG: M23 family metallopeptidase [Lachnospiraceae bacterium]|nr:M23 family metallopeptidase [Lachnospiraceae bacterium]